MATTTPARRHAENDLTAPRHQALGSLLGRVWAVDQVGVEERAASLAKRSIKRDSKLWALDLAIRTVDLTTLEGKDTPGKIRALAGKARRPDPTDLHPQRGRAVCLPEHDPAAAQPSRVRREGRLGGHHFPGAGALEVKLEDVRQVVAAGADEATW
jgi:deoxyribose-phosphate aldolase